LVPPNFREANPQKVSHQKRDQPLQSRGGDKTSEPKAVAVETGRSPVCRPIPKGLTVDQMEAALASAIESYDQYSPPFRVYADAYRDEVKKDSKRGRCGPGWVKEATRVACKLTEWLGNPKIRDITKEVIQDFIDRKLDSGTAPRTVNTHLKHLSTTLSRAVDSGAINRQFILSRRTSTITNKTKSLVICFSC